MNHLEDQLRQALRRQAPPEGFAERVLQRVSPRPRRFRPNAWLVAASLTALVLPLGWLHHQRELRRQREAEQACAQLALALQISSEKLNLALQRIQNPKVNP